MATAQDSISLQVITSPFLRNPESRTNTSRHDVPLSDRRRSLDKLERINMNDLQPIKMRSDLLAVNGKSESAESRVAKKQNRLSREILGVDDEVLAAPDSAPSQPQKLTNEVRNNSVSDSNYHLSCDDDTNSVAFGGSIASTVPDRYGFLGGNQYNPDFEKESLSVSVIRKRELKWLQMLDEWDKYMTQKYKKVRDRCRKGIPSSIRPRAWQYLCGGGVLMRKNQGVFDELLLQPGDPKCLDDIRKDLHRQFPMHEMFADSDGPGQAELFRVLKAYSVLFPEEGYFQGHAPVAAMLVMHMPAEEAFWCLVAICERYLPGYYSQGLEAIQVDGDVLVHMLKRVSPTVHRHLTKQKLDPILYMMEWFLCIFARTLPWGSVLRVWDMFFCEGVKVLFKCGLVLLKYSFTRPRVMKECPTMYESMDLLRHLHPSVTEENALVSRMLKLPIDETEMQRVHDKVVEQRRTAAAVASTATNR